MKNEMKKNRIGGLIGILLVLSCVIVVSVKLTGINVNGSMDSVAVAISDDHEGTEVNNYDFIILEDEELPAASAPVENNSSNAPWVILFVSAIVALISYELWYENCNLRIKALVAESGETGFKAGIGRLHPFRTIDARRELETRAAEHYFR